MRFLVDAQLPPALARWLTEQGHEAEHVYDVGLATASDRAIWRYAQKTGATLITKDDDFVAFTTLEWDGPSVVWIRVGNTTRRGLLIWFAPLLPMVERALVAGERLIEVT